MYMTIKRNFLLLMALFFIGTAVIQTAQPITVYANDISVSVSPDGSTLEPNIPGFGNGNEGMKSTWDTIFNKYKGVITGVSGLALLTAILAFTINLVKLANSGTNAGARTAALQGLLWTGLATVGLGAVSTIVGIFYYMMKDDNTTPAP